MIVEDIAVIKRGDENQGQPEALSYFDDQVNGTGIIHGTIIKVTDFQGQAVKSVTADLEYSKLDLTGYQPGVYLIKIEQNGQNILRKLVLK